MLRCVREGAQLDRLDPVLVRSVIHGMEVPPTSFGRSRRAPEHVGALVVLVSLVVQRLDQEICEVLVKSGAPGVHGRLLAAPRPLICSHGLCSSQVI